METVLSNEKLRVDIRKRIMQIPGTLNCMTDKENKNLTVIVSNFCFNSSAEQYIEKVKTTISACCKEANASVPNLYKMKRGVPGNADTNNISHELVFNFE